MSSAPSPAAEPPEGLDADGLARKFHETYERLAPSFGYETRRESAVPWQDVPEANRNLMRAVCAKVAAPLFNRAAKAEAAVERVRALADEIDTEADVQNVLGAGNWKITALIDTADRIRRALDEP